MEKYLDEFKKDIEAIVAYKEKAEKNSAYYQFLCSLEKAMTYYLEDEDLVDPDTGDLLVMDIRNFYHEETNGDQGQSSEFNCSVASDFDEEFFGKVFCLGGKYSNIKEALDNIHIYDVEFYFNVDDYAGTSDHGVWYQDGEFRAY